MATRTEGVGAAIRVAIVDDHPIVLRGLEEIVLGNFAPVDVALASTGREALELVRTHHFDLIILDLSLPDIDGLDVLKEIRKGKWRPPVLVVSMHPEEEYGLRMLRSGASGYVTKCASAGEIVEAVRKVLAGGKYIGPALSEKFLTEFEAGLKRAPHESLSDREFQVMCMLGSGKTIKEISEQIHVSTNSVRTYRLRIYEKTGLNKMNDLIKYTADHGLAGDEDCPRKPSRPLHPFCHEKDDCLIS